MVLSNEPGYYVAGKWGIRLENLVAISPLSDGYLGCETLTLVPFESKLIDKDILSQEALSWLDEYHRNVYQTVSPHLSDELRGFLATKCAPLLR